MAMKPPGAFDAVHEFSRCFILPARPIPQAVRGLPHSGELEDQKTRALAWRTSRIGSARPISGFDCCDIQPQMEILA
jgi:hypothetical protein